MAASRPACASTAASSAWRSASAARSRRSSATRRARSARSTSRAASRSAARACLRAASRSRCAASAERRCLAVSPLGPPLRGRLALGGPPLRGRFALGGPRRARLRGRDGERVSEPSAEPDVAQLAHQPAVAHLPAGVVVERRCVQRVGDPLERRRAELVAAGTQQAPRRVHQVADGAALLIGGRTQVARVSPARQHAGLRLAQCVAGAQQPIDLGAAGADQLVDRPRRHRRLAQGRDRRRLLALARRPQRAHQRRAFRDEPVQRHAVEVVELHAHHCR